MGGFSCLFDIQVTQQCRESNCFSCVKLSLYSSCKLSFVKMQYQFQILLDLACCYFVEKISLLMYSKTGVWFFFILTVPLCFGIRSMPALQISINYVWLTSPWNHGAWNWVMGRVLTVDSVPFMTVGLFMLPFSLSHFFFLGICPLVLFTWIVISCSEHSLCPHNVHRTFPVIPNVSCLLPDLPTSAGGPWLCVLFSHKTSLLALRNFSFIQGCWLGII